jgi:transcriptional regulator with XRE-family HTH domain
LIESNINVTLPLVRIGEIIRRLREARGLTQAVLARRAGLSRMHVIRIERDDISPTLDTVEKVAKALGVTVRTLLPKE